MELTNEMIEQLKADLSGATTYMEKLKIYDVLGKEVRTLINKKQSPGNYQVHFDASGQPSCVYIYRIKAGSFGQAKKMILLR